ncbi:MAG: OmpA family protein [Yoonia sp.]
MIRLAFCLILFLWHSAAAAQDLTFPSNAKLTRSTPPTIDSFAMPVGPWADGTMPSELHEGQFTQQAWTIAASGLSTLQLVRPLRDQLRNDGFEVLFECRDRACGGFDFRFAISVLPPPEMQVNLGDFRYLAARKDTDDGPVLISLLASRSARAGHVQISRVGANAPTAPEASGAAIRGAINIATTGELSETLVTQGRAVLVGLDFETGSSRLGAGPYPVLDALATFLAAQPTLQVALVGHTDSSGSLEGNITLSKRRAGSVLERLVADYAVPRKQLDAQGMGYLAPIRSNLDEAGRTANRRVEVIITSTN